MITERGIYNNLTDSSYIVSNGDVSLYFSSKIYMLKFLNRYKMNRKENEKRVQRFAGNTKFNFSVWFDIHLYQEIEKRGYHATVWHKDGCIPKEELEKYAISKATKCEVKEWVRK